MTNTVTKAKGVRAIVTGTGFEGRAERIHKHCREGMPLQLRREPDNVHDKDAISVYMQCSRLFGMLKSW